MTPYSAQMKFKVCVRLAPHPTWSWRNLRMKFEKIADFGLFLAYFSIFLLYFPLFWTILKHFQWKKLDFEGH